MQKKTSIGGNKYANVKIDYGSGKLFVSFLKNKSEVKEDMKAFLKHIHSTNNVIPKYIRCDGSGENLKFIEQLKKTHLNIKIEITASDTPPTKWKD